MEEIQNLQLVETQMCKKCYTVGLVGGGQTLGKQHGNVSLFFFLLHTGIILTRFFLLLEHPGRFLHIDLRGGWGGEGRKTGEKNHSSFMANMGNSNNKSSPPSN